LPQAILLHPLRKDKTKLLHCAFPLSSSPGSSFPQVASRIKNRLFYWEILPFRLSQTASTFSQAPLVILSPSVIEVLATLSKKVAAQGQTASPIKILKAPQPRFTRETLRTLVEAIKCTANLSSFDQS
jgi:hypothetical protein